MLTARMLPLPGWQVLIAHSGPPNTSPLVPRERLPLAPIVRARSGTVHQVRNTPARVSGLQDHRVPRLWRLPNCVQGPPVGTRLSPSALLHGLPDPRDPSHVAPTGCCP